MMEATKSRNPLKLSYRFGSYLEKHRIFELFQELSTMLLIKRPEDHVLFLKQSVRHAARRLDTPRIILFAPPGCDKLHLAGSLREKLQVPLITWNDIADNDESTCSLEVRSIIDNLRVLLMNYMSSERDGWILIDFPRNEKEARSLLRSGIIPSHVIEIVVSEAKNHVTQDSCKFPSKAYYYREVRGIRRVFSKYLKTIDMDKESFDDVFEKCLTLFDQRNYSRIPTTLRILLLYFVDQEKCKCLGLKIAEEFNVSYIDFHEVLEQTSLQETDLGDELTKIRQNTDLNDLSSEIKASVFENFLLQSDGLKKGWLLTQFVTSVDDFKQLDLTDFPPNRIVIITPKEDEESKNSNSCICSLCGSSTSTSNSSTVELTCECEEDNCQRIREYAGKTALVIPDSDDLNALKETIESYLMSNPACVPPRIPRIVPEMKFEEIEFDPDDEPSPGILNCVRRPESMLPLI